MKKKLLALAVAGAFIAPVAMADNVTVYGVMNGTVDNVSISSAGTNVNATKISSHESHIGFKGSEDLGGGTSAVFQIESQVELDNGGNSHASTGVVTGSVASAVTITNTRAANHVGSTGLGGRNTFVGLSGSGWGSLLLGTNDTPYKNATRKMDMFDSTLADNRSLMGMSTSGLGFDRRANNSVTYNTPDMSGFKAAVQYQAGAEGATGTLSKGSAWSLAANYTSGPLTGLLAYETHDFGAAAGDLVAVAPAVVDKKESAYKIGIGYAVDQFAVNAYYEKTQDSFAVAPAASTDLAGHKNYYVSGKYNISASDAVKLGYTHAGSLNNTNNTGAKQVSVGYDHNMGKRTTVYALWTKLSNDSGQAYALGAADVTTATTAAGALDNDISAVSIGIKHAF